MAPALEVLELVLKDRQGQALDFGPEVEPPAAFALLVADAFDGGMTAAEWSLWTSPGSNQRLRDALLAIWRTEVWPKFVQRFEISG